MTEKLWTVWRGCAKLATVHNDLTQGLQEHIPNEAEIRAALPARLRHMTMRFWSRRAPLGDSVECTIDLFRANGDQYGVMHAYAYEVTP